ncbi:Hypothetical protein, conserved [Brucella abortus str. 2308 A]|uniref:Uncharacterized protein n=3 Tax=Brucella TaxID=234 RepID=A0A0H3AR64_BRUO2|nr:hypothetical protein BOV_A0041 [Brucella ovis ATCC 25840]ABY39075.1 Hypothetical protein, conserved [Brucella suis ATCC 23445]ACU49186.1 hypothetical protein BMI_II45 [Brucella microti CCM 4915]ADZ67295.1 conserved hypothetical protein [Brucella melitensis M28]ADZ88163.1 conserved hypothetical protein [Brucella melitensis M5-90]AEK55505.1 hypothetical protein BPI_II45 [Brucella pinnipedialis B2/94]AEW15908.1 hypothetical protein BCA52141_II1171 [Brucella canis HSK A52141]AEW18734.1 hypoth
MQTLSAWKHIVFMIAEKNPCCKPATLASLLPKTRHNN